MNDKIKKENEIKETSSEDIKVEETASEAVSYTHLTLPTKRIE